MYLYIILYIYLYIYISLSYLIKVINIFCKIVIRKMLAIKLNTSIAQKSNTSLCIQLPRYVAFIDVRNS